MPSIHVASPTDGADNTRLDRRRWHSPLISLIITHRNYADHVEEALLSILDQTHKNWECIIVDDASSPEHLSKLNEILARTASAKIRLIESRERVVVGAADAYEARCRGCFDPHLSEKAGD